MAKLTWRGTLSAGAAIAMLSSCAGAQPPVAPSLMQQVDAAKNKKSFTFTGKEQTFTVPAGVTAVKIVAAGASGPSGRYSGSGSGYYQGGNGGLVTATIPATPA